MWGSLQLVQKSWTTVVGELRMPTNNIVLSDAPPVPRTRYADRLATQGLLLLQHLGVALPAAPVAVLTGLDPGFWQAPRPEAVSKKKAKAAKGETGDGLAASPRAAHPSRPLGGEPNILTGQEDLDETALDGFARCSGAALDGPGQAEAPAQQAAGDAGATPAHAQPAAGRKGVGKSERKVAPSPAAKVGGDIHCHYCGYVTVLGGAAGRPFHCRLDVFSYPAWCSWSLVAALFRAAGPFPSGVTQVRLTA